MATKNKSTNQDPELKAIGSILGALQGLEGDAIQRVLDYVLERLSLNRSQALTAQPSTVSGSGIVTPIEVSSSGPVRKMSIRDLKEDKRPTSANQMAALVAYYLSEVADPEERKDSINGSDLQKYFKQAGFRLPKSMPHALPNAAAAGYFSAVGGGQYKLNPVGYNLIVHGLPHSDVSAGKRKSRAS